MKKRILFAFAAFAASAVVIAVALFWPSLDIFSGWDYAFLVAGLGFLFSLWYLISAARSGYWLEIQMTVGPIAAVTGIAFFIFSFVSSLLHFFAPGWSIFPDKVQNILLIASVFVLFCSMSYFREWPRS